MTLITTSNYHLTGLFGTEVALLVHNLALIVGAPGVLAVAHLALVRPTRHASRKSKWLLNAGSLPVLVKSLLNVIFDVALGAARGDLERAEGGVKVLVRTICVLQNEHNERQAYNQQVTSPATLIQL